jgi:hypothetical protein
MIIAVQRLAVGGFKNDRRGNLTFSDSVRKLSRAGTSCRHLVTADGSSDDTSSSAVEALSSSNSVHRRLSRAGTSPRPHLVTDEQNSDDFAEDTSSSPERPPIR